MIRGFVSGVPSMGVAIRVPRGERVSLPVAPGSYIYSHFEHVSGTPAPKGVRGVAINKLKLLDVLIEQLRQIRGRPDGEAASPLSLSEDGLDALIEQYEHQISQAWTLGGAAPYQAGPAAPVGVLFNLVA